MHNLWYKEIIRNLAVIIGFGVAGYATGYTLLGIIAGLLVSLLVLYQQIHCFSQWLSNEPLEEPANDTSFIGNLYYHAFYIDKKHKDQVRHLEHIIRRYEESARALPDAVIVLNTRNEVEWLNAAAKKLLGLKRKKDVGQTISNLIRHPEFSHYLMRKDFKYPVEFPSPINENIQISARIISYARESRLLVIRDVTQLHKLDQMRQEFIANTSHELRTPLTVITGYLESLQEMEQGENKEIIDTMLNQSRHMETIIRDMLLLARLETLQNHRESSRVPVNIAQRIDSIINDAKTISAVDHNFKVDIDPQLNLLGLETELHSALSNLIQNAVLYTPNGSTITITWRKNKKGKANFIVEDNGPGIETKHLARLTERFYRVNASRSRESGGTGLGLAIVQQVIKHHDGRLKIESKIGEGSRFICEFPAHLVLNKPVPQLKAVN